eukprot:403344934
MKIVALLLSTVCISSVMCDDLYHEDRDLSGCSVELDSNIFNLMALQRTLNDTTDYKIDFKTATGSQSLEFNFCENSLRTCSDNKKDFANFVDEKGQCTHLSSNSLSDIVVTLQSEEEPERGINLDFISPAQCNATDFYKLRVQLNCDKNAVRPIYSLDSDTTNQQCYKKVVFASREGCPKLQLGILWHFFSKYANGFALVMIALGFFFLMYGGRYHQKTLFLFGQLTFVAFAMVIFYGYAFPKNSPEWSVWLSLVVTLAMGTGPGYFTQKWARSGVLLIGAWIGGLFGAIFYTAFIAKYATENPMLALWLCIVFFSIFVAVLSQIYFDYAVIFGSAIVGSYMFIRGISIYIGGFPNEFILYQNYMNGSVGQTNKTLFVYLFIMIVMAFSSMLAQFRMRQGNAAEYNLRSSQGKYDKF